MTNSTAVAAIVSPWWLPILQQVSEVAAAIVPILGVIWLLIQIVGYISGRRRRK